MKEKINNPENNKNENEYVLHGAPKKAQRSKTNYSNFRARSSKKFEIPALLSQSKIMTNTLANNIASKRWQFQICWKIIL